MFVTVNNPFLPRKAKPANFPRKAKTVPYFPPQTKLIPGGQPN
jgi:hypothetical protein